MYGSRLVSGLAAVLAGTAAVFAVLALVYNPVFLTVSLVFGAAAYFVWYHASGQFAQRLYRGVEQQANPAGGTGAGPRGEWTPPRDGDGDRRARAERARRQRARAGPGGARSAREQGQRRQRRAAPTASSGPTAAEAYDTLGLDPGADDQAIREAYRDLVKEVHPDSPSGDEEEFKEVKSAYERLTDD